MSHRFYFGQSSDSDSDESALPHPQPLPRAAFHAPDFAPAAFLASLRDRHQTLEDLRQELRARSQALGAELLDLVNADYAAFLALGSGLAGGADRVQEARLGLLGFQREVDGVRASAAARRREVAALVAERRAVRREARRGQGLLEAATQLEELEASLGLAGAEAEDALDLDLSDSEDEAGDAEEGGGELLSLGRLAARVRHYVRLVKLRDQLGADQPFLASMADRLGRARETLLLDMASVLRQSHAQQQKERVLKAMDLYRQLDASAEAIRTLKEVRK